MKRKGRRVNDTKMIQVIVEVNGEESTQRHKTQYGYSLREAHTKKKTQELRKTVKDSVSQSRNEGEIELRSEKKRTEYRSSEKRRRERTKRIETIPTQSFDEIFGDQF